MEKIILRQDILKKLKSHNQSEKLRKDKLLFEALLLTKAYQESKVIATYLAFDFEYNTKLFISAAQADGKTIVVPKTYGQGDMDFVLYDEENLEQTRFGLLEPKSSLAVSKSEIDMIHVPGVVFNSEGYRIGYGGGYYDRYLSDYEGMTVSTIYDFQKASFVEDVHDIAVKEVLSQ